LAHAATRHNVGAWFVDALAQQTNHPLSLEKKFFARFTKLDQNNHTYWLLKPTTYMNESGKSVAAMAHFYKIAPHEMVVVHDELDFPAGEIRLKQGGGHGGHNGLRDIIQVLGTSDFYRIRLGIGHPGHRDHVTGYVLGAPANADKTLILQAIDQGLAVIPDLIQGEFQKAMRDLHN
jgi:PTH1 family peptidyl-tRNA hydrolase